MPPETHTAMRALSPGAVDFGMRCAQHARERPDEIALVLVGQDGRESQATWRELDERVSGMTQRLLQAGANGDVLVIIALPTCLAHFVTALAAWRIGACVLPLNPAMPQAERDNLLALAGAWRPLLIVGEWTLPGVSTLDRATAERPMAAPATAPPTAVPCPGKAIASGGSTGTPKIIVDPKPWAQVPGKWGALLPVGLRPGQTQLLAGSLYHNVGFFLGHVGLFEGHRLIVPERFDAALVVDLIERHGVQFMGLLPIMMQRIAKLPGIERRDFSRLEGIYHSGGVCPPWVKRIWLKLMPPSRIWELYGSTEDVGITMISGEDWLAHPGSVGRGFFTDLLVLDEHGQPAAPGQVGEIHMRSTVPPEVRMGEFWPLDPGSRYVGAAAAKSIDCGYTSIGDMGHLDEGGYLHLADRRTDMIKSGGINVYPAEVEAALSQHCEVHDVVVIGVPDEEWGQRVHALVQPAQWPGALDGDVLDRHCRQRLTAYKIPKSYELCRELPRDPSGKIRRSALRDERIAGRYTGLVTTASKPTGVE